MYVNEETNAISTLLNSPCYSLQFAAICRLADHSIFRLSITRAVDFEIRYKKYIEFGKRRRCIRMFAGGEQRGNLGKPFTYALRVPYKLIFLIARSFAYAAFPRYLESRAKREMHSNEIPFGIDSKLRICVCVCVSTLVLRQMRTSFREQ